MFDLLGLIIIGAAAGYGAGHVMKGKGFGLLGNIAVGVVGAVLGGFLFSLLGGAVGQTDYRLCRRHRAVVADRLF